MLRFLIGIPVRALYDADFEMFCSALFIMYSANPRKGIVCGKKFNLFGKGAKTNINNYNYIGKALVDCQNLQDLPALLQM